APMPASLTLTGTVIDQTTRQALAGLEVQIWPTSGNVNQALATPATDDAGEFVVQLDLPSRGLAQAITFKILQAGRLLELADDEIKWGGHGLTRTVSIPVQDAILGDYIVSGKVLNVNGPAMAGVTVKAVHKKLRSEIALGQVTTGDDGSYQIKYAVPDGETQV